MKRREFIKTSIILSGGYLLGLSPSAITNQNYPTVVIVKDGEPGQMVRKALKMLGGVSRFISSGDYVLVKPNMSWDRRPEFAATTNPEVVHEIVTLCYEAGASRVLVIDNTCNEARRCYESSKIKESALRAGADVQFVKESQFKETAFPGARVLKSWKVHVEALKVDKLINVPILKHHSLSGITAGFKNMMGLLGGNRGRLHLSFHEKIVDVNRLLVPQLTIIDAVRILKTNGPTGGSLDYVDQANTIIAGTDRVLVEAFAAKAFGLEPRSLKYLNLAYNEGMGEIDTDKFKPSIYCF